jgi:hypothetical protein
MRVCLAFFALIAAFITASGLSQAREPEETSKLVFSTFDNSSAGDYAYLRDSIQNMLISRLTAKDTIKIVEGVLSSQELNMLKNRKDFATVPPGFKDIDFMVTGSLFQTTGGLNVQVSLYPLGAEGEMRNFTIISEDEKNIISDINKLSAEIAQTGLGYPADALQVSGDTESRSGNTGFTTAHPEAAYKRGLYTGTVVGGEYAGFTTKAAGVKRKLSLDGEITGLIVGDADGKGEDEIITLEGSRVAVYRVTGTTINKIAETQLSRRLRVHAISLADINKDGVPEIFLSATDGISVASFIMQWGGGDSFTTLSENIPYYIRAVEIPGKGMQLCGQGRGRQKIDFVRPGIHIFDLDASMKPQIRETLPLPKSINLFDFSYGDLDGDGYFELIAVDQNEKLKVYSPSNELMWVSSGKYGGSKTYIGPSQGEATNEQDKRNITVNEDRDRELVYVPGKIFVSDIDRDGKDEVVVSASKMSAVGWFNRLRPYKSGVVMGLIWNENELLEIWRTGTYQGYLADFSFELHEQPAAAKGVDARSSLYVANIPSSGSFASMLPGAASTNLSVYELIFSKVKAEQKE